MSLEFDALQQNRTWRLVDWPLGANVVTSKWVFKHKLNPDGPLERYNACWVMRGFTQCAGIDFGETFSPVVKPAMIRIVLTIAASRRCPTKQLDVSNPSFMGISKSMCSVSNQRALSTPATLMPCVSLTNPCMGYVKRRAPGSLALPTSTPSSDSRRPSLLRHGSEVAYLLIYVDDIVLTNSSTGLLQHIINHLCDEFVVKDMNELHFFLSIDVQRTSSGIYLS